MSVHDPNRPEWASPVGMPKGRKNSFAHIAELKYKAQAHRLANADFFYCISEEDAASLLRISGERATAIRLHPLYKERLAFLQKKFDDMEVEGAIAAEGRRLKMALAALVPVAIDVLRDGLAAKSKTDQRLAAIEVLDRDGRLVKVSKTQAVAPGKDLPAPTEATLAEFAEDKPAKPN